jgi:hypothetical protein
MPTIHEGGCLCGAVRYRTIAEPVRVMICHCSFCQRLTGSAYLVEPIFKREHVKFEGAQTSTFDHCSDTSAKRVTVHFCGTCATTVCLEVERFPNILGLCGGTFDDPNWFARGADTCSHIFTRSAQNGVSLPSGYPLYEEHALQTDGKPNRPFVLAQAIVVSR